MLPPFPQRRPTFDGSTPLMARHRQALDAIDAYINEAWNYGARLTGEPRREFESLMKRLADARDVVQTTTSIHFPSVNRGAAG